MRSQFGKCGKEVGSFDGPMCLAVSAAGGFVVADTGNNRVQAFSPSGQFLCVVDSLTDLARPRFVGLASDGAVMVVDDVCAAWCQPIDNLGGSGSVGRLPSVVIRVDSFRVQSLAGSDPWPGRGTPRKSPVPQIAEHGDDDDGDASAAPDAEDGASGRQRAAAGVGAAGAAAVVLRRKPRPPAPGDGAAPSATAVTVAMPSRERAGGGGGPVVAAPGTVTRVRGAGEDATAPARVVPPRPSTAPRARASVARGGASGAAGRGATRVRAAAAPSAAAAAASAAASARAAKAAVRERAAALLPPPAATRGVESLVDARLLERRAALRAVRRAR